MDKNVIYYDEAVRALRKPSTFLKELLFKDFDLFEGKYVEFDMDMENEQLAPYVSPCVEGKPMANTGFITKQFAPAYIKPTDHIKPEKFLNRTFGENPKKELSLQQRKERYIAERIIKHGQMLDLREEQMIAESLLTGKLVIEGQDYPRAELDFGRHPNHTITLTPGTDTWDVATSEPVDNLEDWAERGYEESGANLDIAILSATAWKAFKNHQDVNDILDKRRGVDSSLEITPKVAKTASYKGDLGNIEIWVYNKSYTDITGTKRKMIPDDYMVLTSRDILGKRYYGAIMDFDNFRPSQMFTKSYYEHNPSAQHLLSQSAPLVVPRRINATISAKVL